MAVSNNLRLLQILVEENSFYMSSTKIDAQKVCVSWNANVTVCCKNVDIAINAILVK